MTPSLPTLSIASAMISPTLVSAAEIDAVAAICSLVSTSFAWLPSTSDTEVTACSIPRLSAIGLAPAATFRRPSRTSAWASTVAVVVPSPATSSVFFATSLTSSAPIFSNGSSSSISLAMLTPSLVIVGAPHFFSSTTLRPFGPSVTLTASASWFMPRSRPRRASSSNAINLAIGCGPHFSYGHARRVCVGRWCPRRPAPRVTTGLTAYRLALTIVECQLVFSTHPCRVQERHPLTAAAPDRGPGPLWKPRGSGRDDGDAVGLRPLGALDDLELDLLVLVQGLVALRLDRRVVDEDVFAAVHGDEAVALLVVEPLHDTACHVHSLLGGLPDPTPRGTRGLRSWPPRPAVHVPGGTVVPRNAETRHYDRGRSYTD